MSNSLQFNRGGKPFTATFDAESCIIKDETEDTRFGLKYAARVTDIHANIKGKYIKVEVEFGLLSPTGELLNIQTQSWTFRDGDPDYAYFRDNFGLAFMSSSVNGFVKHFMKKHPRYSALVSSFGQVMNDQGIFIEENND